MDNPLLMSGGKSASDSSPRQATPASYPAPRRYCCANTSSASRLSASSVSGTKLCPIGWISSSWGNLGALAGKRTTRYGANAALYSLAFIFLLIAVNYLASRYPHQFDLTVEKAFSLSPQSLQIVKQLKQPLKLYGFVQNGHNPYAEELYGEGRASAHMRKFGIKYAALHPQHLVVRAAFAIVKDLDEWRAVLAQWYAEDLPGCYPDPAIHRGADCEEAA